MAAKAYSAKLSSKGQVTVPIAIRKRLGVKAGDRIAFVAEATRTVVRPGRDDEEEYHKVLRKYAGALPFPGGPKAVIRWIREMRDQGV